MSLLLSCYFSFLSYHSMAIITIFSLTTKETIVRTKLILVIHNIFFCNAIYRNELIVQLGIFKTNKDHFNVCHLLFLLPVSPYIAGIFLYDKCNFFDGGLLEIIFSLDHLLSPQVPSPPNLCLLHVPAFSLFQGKSIH